MKIRILRANDFSTTAEYQDYIQFLILTGWKKVFTRFTSDPETSYTLFEKEAQS